METLVSSEPGMEAMNRESPRSRLKALTDVRANLFCSSDASSDDPKKLVEDCVFDFQEKFGQIDAEEQNVASLGLEDLAESRVGLYIEQLKKDIGSEEEKNSKICDEINTLTTMVIEDSVRLDGEIEALNYSLNFFDSQDLYRLNSSNADDKQINGQIHQNQLHISNEQKFESLELIQRIEKNKSNLILLQNLDYALQRSEAIGQLEHMFSEVEVIDLQGSCIKLSLKTPIPNMDRFLLKHKLDFVEPFVPEHEMLIEVSERNMELRNVQILPADVFIDEIVDTAKSSRDLLSPNLSSLGWLMRQVQHRIILSTLRHLLVKDANKSRHSFEYLDKDDTVTAHLVGGIDAFIKLPQDWPISSRALKLLSIKNRDHHSKSISLTFLCKAKELANSLDMHSRLHLARFADSIEEILLQEMQSELRSCNIIS